MLHSHLYAKFTDDLEDIVPKTNLPKFQEKPYGKEPYLEALSCSSTRRSTTTCSRPGTGPPSTQTAAPASPANP